MCLKLKYENSKNITVFWVLENTTTAINTKRENLKYEWRLIIVVLDSDICMTEMYSLIL